MTVAYKIEGLDGDEYADAVARINRYQASLPGQPVDIIGLIKEFGCEYMERTMPPNVSGAIERDGGQYKILINMTNSLNRKRFTAAHELAHYIKHRPYLQAHHTENIMLRSGMSNKYEVEANKIAADILMPMEVVNERAETIKSFNKMAEIFGVSRQAMLVRLGVPEYSDL